MSKEIYQQEAHENLNRHIFMVSEEDRAIRQINITSVLWVNTYTPLMADGASLSALQNLLSKVLQLFNHPVTGFFDTKPIIPKLLNYAK